VLDDANRVEVSGNVLHRVRGHGIALVGSVRQAAVKSNVVVGCVPSSGIDGDRPAGYFITHPNVEITNNVASGCHVGFLLDYPTNTSTGCAQTAPAGRNSRNVALRSRLHGMWVRRHYPLALECGVRSVDKPLEAAIRTFMAFDNAQHGLFLEDVGEYSVVGCSFLQNGAAGVAIDRITPGAQVQISLTTFVSMSTEGRSFDVFPDATLPVAGVMGPGSEGLYINNCSFEKFQDGYTDSAGAPVRLQAFVPCALCHKAGYEQPGGFTYLFRALLLPLTPNRVFLLPPYDAIVVDLDGSLFFEWPVGDGSANYTGIISYGYLQGLPACRPPNVTVSSGPHQYLVCDATVRMHRVAIFDVRPTLVTRGPLNMSSALGHGLATFRTHARVPWQSAYVFVVPTGDTNDNLATNTNRLNFTIVTSGGDWDSLNVHIHAAQEKLLPYLHLQFAYRSDVLRFDVIARTVSDDGTGLSPIIESDFVIPTEYTAPYDPPVAVGRPRAKQPSRCFIHTQRSRLHLLYEESAAAFFFVERRACPTTGCIRMQEPVVPPRRYNWIDTRAWPNETVPQDGDDVVIPPGVTVVLSTNTSRLRSLVIQGTLELHPRLTAEIYAAYVVVFGGALVVPSVPHTAAASITLLSAMDTPPLGVEQGIVFRPGTLINYGTVNVVGIERAATWSHVTQTTPAGGTEIKLLDLVQDWVPGDIAVVSSGSYHAAEVDEVVVTQTTTDNRGFAVAAPVAHMHLGVSEEATGTIQFFIRAKAAVLTRSIVIESERDANGNRTGCLVSFGQYGRDVHFAAQGILAGAEIRYCGFANETTSRAIEVVGVRRYPVELRGLAVHHCNGQCLVIQNSTAITLQKSVFYLSYGSTIQLLNSPGNELIDNIVIGTKFPTDMPDPDAPLALCAYESLDSPNLFRSNVAAGSDSEGFCIQLGACGNAQLEVSGNEALACVTGFFFVPSAPGTACVAAQNLLAWHNSFVGVHLSVDSDVEITNAKLHDNHIAIHTSSVGAAHTTYITGGAIAGRSTVLDIFRCEYFTCSMRSRDRYCMGRAELFGDTESHVMGEIGILVGSSVAEPVPPAYSRAADDLPYTKPRMHEWPGEGGFVEVNNVAFVNFMSGGEEGRCDGGRAVATNEFLLNPAQQHMFNNISWVSFNEGGQAFINKPSDQWRGNNMCALRLCDALNHVALHDGDGSLSGTGVPGAIISDYRTSAMLCQYNRRWSAYHCPHHYGQLHVRNFDDDALTRAMGPIEIQDQAFLARVNSAEQPPACYGPCSVAPPQRPGFVTTVVQTQRTFLVDFTGDAPRRTSFILRDCLSNLDAIIVRILIPGENDLTVWAGGAPSMSRPGA